MSETTTRETPKHVILALVEEITQATARLQHHGRIAWTVARAVAPTLDAEQQNVRTALAQGGDRYAIARFAGEAGMAFDSLLDALSDAKDLKARAEGLVQEQRDRRVEPPETVEGVENIASADEMSRLLGALDGVSSALSEAKVRMPVIDALLLRRLHAAFVVAVERHVTVIGDRLRALRNEVERVHAIADAPDPIAHGVVALLDRLHLPEPPQRTVTWPDWTRDPFALPVLNEPL